MIRITKKGPKVQAVQHHNAPIPKPEPGEHLWMLMAMYRVEAPHPNAEYQMDTENLVTIDGPGCYVCERMWTEAIGARPCPGEPKR